MAAVPPKALSKDLAAYQAIKNLLFQRRLPPGQKIIYRDLEETLGMSKTPIITALARLESEGLVVSHQNRGFYVRELSADEIRQMYDLRIRMEWLAIDYAIDNRASRSIDRLATALDRYLAYSPPFYDARSFQLDSEFHAAIADLGGNSFLLGMLEQFYLTGWVSVNVAAMTPLIDQFRADHRDIFAAIERGDRKAAKSVLRRHLGMAHDAIAAASTATMQFAPFTTR
jgi:DNA-binding GntR family transcriptional regulator